MKSLLAFLNIYYNESIFKACVIPTIKEQSLDSYQLLLLIRTGSDIAFR